VPGVEQEAETGDRSARIKQASKGLFESMFRQNNEAPCGLHEEGGGIIRAVIHGRSPSANV